MERYFQIVKVNWKFNLLPHVLIALFICLAAPFFMGVKNLNLMQTAQVLELYMVLLGIILCVPLFIPDEDKSIRDLIESKKQSMISVHVIRIIEGLLILALFIGAFLVYLKLQQCNFTFPTYFYGTMAGCIFLGGIGILVYSIFDYLSVAYMVPILYYILCYGSGKTYLGKFYLFSMMRGSMEEKKYLLIAGLLMIVLGILLRNIRVFRGRIK